MNKQSIEDHFDQIRSRMGCDSHDTGLYDSTTRLIRLKTALNIIGKQTNIDIGEVYKHFPVACVAVLETYFKTLIACFIDSGSPYFDRGLLLAKDKLRSVDIVPILNRKKVTVGQLVSHILPFNSLASIENAFDCLLDEKFKKVASKTRPIHAVRLNIEDAKPITKDISELWRKLTILFERRHILAHEAAINYEVSFKDAQDAIDCTEELIYILDSILWSTAWANEPISNVEMKKVAYEDLKDTREKLASILWKALCVAKKTNQKSRFINLHSSWKKYAKDCIAWEHEPFEMGSIRPLIAYGAESRILKQRLEDLSIFIAHNE